MDRSWREAALTELNERIRDIRDPADLAFAAAEILGRTLGVSRAGYGTIDTASETITIERDWNAPGIKSLAGVLNFRDYGSYIEDLKRGETVVFADAEKDPRTAATADALKGISAQSLVNMPVTEEGGLVALLYINNATARPWTDDELDFIRDIAERTRTAVERRRVEEVLRESEERFRTVFENAGVGMLEIDSEWRILTANKAYAEMVGFSRKDLAGQSCLAFTHPDDVEISETSLRRAESGEQGQRITFEKRYVRGDGEIVWVRSNLTRVSEQGESARFLKVVEDITAAKLAQEALREETQNLETLNRTGEAVASELDLEKVVQLVTDAGVQLTGAQFGAFFYNLVNSEGESYTLYTISGVPRSKFDKFPMPRNTHVFAPTFVGEGVVRSDDITKDPRYGQNAPYYGMPKGHLPVVSYLAVPVMGRSGGVIGGLFFGHAKPGIFDERHERLMVGLAAQAAIAIDNATLYRTVQDAKETLEHRVAEALAERKTLADIVESTDAFVQVVDPDFNFMAVNRASATEFERIFGIRPKAGDNMLDLLAHKPEHQAAVKAVWARALKGEEFTEIAEFGDPALDRRFYEMKYNSLKDDGGKVIGAYQFVYDVTERLQDQKRLAEAEEALRQSQKMEAVGQLVSGLAHDFNNVLGAVVAAFDMMRRRADDADRVRRFAEAGMQAADRGAKLTAQLLAFSRTQRIELAPLSVADVVEEIAELIDRTVGPMIEVEFSFGPQRASVLADATQLEMSVLNLALNARDAMPDGGKLFIGTCVREVKDDPDMKPGEYVELTVTDTGEGMDEDVLRRALDPFFTTKPVGKGTGLGLAQVYGSARQAGGTVRIESKEGEGTTVRLFLPRTHLPKRELASAANLSGPSHAGVKVLLIDDDEDLRNIVASGLNALGYDVEAYEDGPSGLAALKEQQPDVLVVDFAMPGMNGAEVAREGRLMWPGLPVVLATGYADTDAIERAIGKDARLLRKPFRIDELLNAVGEVVR